MMSPFIPPLIAFVVALGVTPLVRALAWRFGVVDHPTEGRKKHGRPVALLGGIAIFFALLAGIAAALASGWIPSFDMKANYLVGIVVALAILAFGGALDDAFNLPPRWQIVWPILAVAAVVASGIGVTYITNPFGGQIFLNRQGGSAPWVQSIPYVAEAFTVLWLLGITYTTKFLDGLDGLVSGVTVIGALVIAAVSITRDVTQPDTAVLALVIAAAFAGFLIFNSSPASIFLGEGGSTMAGFLLGTIAIISGGKIATTLLVLGLPIFDAIFVIIRRVIKDRKSPTSADRSHLHFRLLDFGFTPRQVVFFYYFIAAFFGASTLILQGWEKAVAIFIIISTLIALTAAGMLAYRKKA